MAQAGSSSGLRKDGSDAAAAGAMTAEDFSSAEDSAGTTDAPVTAAAAADAVITAGKVKSSIEQRVRQTEKADLMRRWGRGRQAGVCCIAAPPTALA